MTQQHPIFAQPDVAIVDIEFEFRAQIEMLDQSFLTHGLTTQATVADIEEDPGLSQCQYGFTGLFDFLVCRSNLLHPQLSGLQQFTTFGQLKNHIPGRTVIPDRCSQCRYELVFKLGGRVRVTGTADPIHLHVDKAIDLPNAPDKWHDLIRGSRIHDHDVIQTYLFD